MALFTDGPISSTSDLQAYENGILVLASTEGIDLAGKIQIAQDDIGNQLLMFLLRRMPYQDFHWSQRRARGVSDVVVSASLKQWHVHYSLALVYRDAYNNQLNDRYKEKWNEYEQLAKRSRDACLATGVGIVAEPIARPAIPLLSSVAGTGLGGTFYVAITCVNGGGQEGSPSDTASININNGEQLAVAVFNPPSNAVGWNAYVGISPGALSLQNQAPLGLDASWTQSGALAPGNLPGSGQTPSWFVMDQKVAERG